MLYKKGLAVLKEEMLHILSLNSGLYQEGGGRSV